MDFQTESVPGGMDKFLFQAMLLQNFARCRVHSASRGARAHGGDPGQLGFKDSVVKIANFLGSAAKVHH